MNFFPSVTPVQIQPLDLGEIQKTNIGNAMGRVGLQNMQDEMGARHAIGEFITANGGLPKTPAEMNKMAMTLASRGYPMEQAMKVAAEAQNFALTNQKLGLYQQANSAFGGGDFGGGSVPSAQGQGTPSPSTAPAAGQQRPPMALPSDPLASGGQQPPVQQPSPVTDGAGITMPNSAMGDLKTDIQGTADIPGFISGASTGKLIPEFDKRLNGFAQAYLAATGEPLRMTDSYRGYDAQVDVKNRKGSLAATPGASIHGYGGAADIDPAQADKAAKLGLLQMYGLDRPLNGRAVNPEPWHIQPTGLNEQGLRATGPSGYKPGREYSQFLPQMGGGVPNQPQVAGLNTPSPIIQADISKFTSAAQTSPNAPAIQFVRADIVQANPSLFFDPQTKQPRTVSQVAQVVMPNGQAPGQPPAQLAQAGPQMATDASAPPPVAGAQQLPALPPMPMPPIQGTSPGSAVNKFRDIVQRNPSILMLPEVDSMVKTAITMDGYRTPEQQEAIKFAFDQQRAVLNKRLDAQYNPQIAGATRTAEGQAAMGLEVAGGPAVTPKGKAEEAKLVKTGEIQAGLDTGTAETLNSGTARKAKEGGDTDLRARQAKLIDEHDRDTQDYYTWAQIHGMADVSGLGANANITLAKVIQAAAPGQYTDTQLKGANQNELRKLLAGQLASKIKAQGGNQNEMSQKIEELANPDISLTPKMLRDIAEDQMKKMQPRLNLQAKTLSQPTGSSGWDASTQAAREYYGQRVTDADTMRQNKIGQQTPATGQPQQPLDTFWK